MNLNVDYNAEPQNSKLVISSTKKASRGGVIVSAFLISIALLILAIILYQLFTGGPGLFQIFGSLVAFCFAISGYALLVYSVNRKVFELSVDAVLTLSFTPLWNPFTRRVSVDGVDQVAVSEVLVHRGSIRPSYKYAVNLQSAGRVVKQIHLARTIDEALFIEREMENYLGIDDVPDLGIDTESRRANRKASTLSQPHYLKQKGTSFDWGSKYPAWIKILILWTLFGVFLLNPFLFLLFRPYFNRSKVSVEPDESGVIQVLKVKSGVPGFRREKVFDTAMLAQFFVKVKEHGRFNETILFELWAVDIYGEELRLTTSHFEVKPLLYVEQELEKILNIRDNFVQGSEMYAQPLEVSPKSL